jgi:hypothetical protein
MPTIQYRDLQYQTEMQYYSKLRGLLESLRARHAEFAKRTEAKEREFYQLLAHSLRVSEAAGIRAITDQANRRLGTSFRVHVFVSAFPTARAMCMPRFGPEQVSDSEPVIVVSQHLLNELGPEEQLCIIGHELGHIVFGHAFIPAAVILKCPFKMQDIGTLKSDVLKWMICAEVSCDLMGFIAGDRNVPAFVEGMWKFTTGIQRPGLSSLGQEPISALAARQFDEFAGAGRADTLSTHPMTLLRTRIIERVAELPLLQQYGHEVPAHLVQQYKTEFNGAIDELVGKVYPEVASRGSLPHGEILFDAGLAVVLADGRIHPREVETLVRLSGTRRDVKAVLREVQAALRVRGHDGVIKELVDRAVKSARAARVSAQGLRTIVRQLLVIAASDNQIEKTELDVIRLFGSGFGWGLPGLLGMIGQLGV